MLILNLLMLKLNTVPVVTVVVLLVMDTSATVTLVASKLCGTNKSKRSQTTKIVTNSALTSVTSDAQRAPVLKKLIEMKPAETELKLEACQVKTRTRKKRLLLMYVVLLFHSY